MPAIRSHRVTTTATRRVFGSSVCNSPCNGAHNDLGDDTPAKHSPREANPSTRRRRWVATSVDMGRAAAVPWLRRPSTYLRRSVFRCGTTANYSLLVGRFRRAPRNPGRRRGLLLHGALPPFPTTSPPQPSPSISPSCPPPPPCGRLPQPKVPAPPPLPPALIPRFEGFPSLPWRPLHLSLHPTCTSDLPHFLSFYGLVRLFRLAFSPLSAMSNCTHHQAISNLPLLHISLICTADLLLPSSFLLQDK